ncbi:MAG: hypothetical protein GY811_10305 [Myxococcales bacterium]|nr:hypothetical protein [Myxococcales bacterium]
MKVHRTLAAAALLLGSLLASDAAVAAPGRRIAKPVKSQRAKAKRPSATAGSRATAKRRNTNSKPHALVLRPKARSAKSMVGAKADTITISPRAAKLHEALTQAVEANFKKFPNQREFLPKERTVYHSIRQQTHRDLWKGKYNAEGTSMIGEWMAGGKYAGIWTTSKKAGLHGGEGWYSDKGNRAVKLTLKKKALFIDLQDPAQKQIYKDWQKQTGQDKYASPKDLFQTMKGPDGTPLAKRAGGIGAPVHGDFLVQLGIAGVIHYDVYGQGNPVLLNPHAIEKVEF